MTTFALGEVIAIRTLVQNLETSEKTVVVKLGRPQQGADAHEFVCPFVVQGVGDDRVHVAYGVDAFQALQEAIRVLSMYLHEKVNPRFGNTLRWIGGKSGDIGFIRPSVSRDVDEHEADW